jgi:periplasmic protein CpxP/Spy
LRLLRSLTPAPPPGTPAPAPAKPTHASRLENRIKQLHAELKITPAEEPQWEEVAQVMRDNAKTVEALIRERAQKASKMSAVEDLESYQAIAEAHAAGVAKLVTAFRALYAVMPADQQKIADAVFAKSQHHPRPKKKTVTLKPAP